jgi:hypothetical protein
VAFRDSGSGIRTGVDDTNMRSFPISIAITGTGRIFRRQCRFQNRRPLVNNPSVHGEQSEGSCK